MLEAIQDWIEYRRWRRSLHPLERAIVDWDRNMLKMFGSLPVGGAESESFDYDEYWVTHPAIVKNRE